MMNPNWQAYAAMPEAKIYSERQATALVAAARAQALEDAALACDKRQFEYGECPETASYCAAAIRALKEKT